MGVSTDAILVYGVPLPEDAIGDFDEGIDPESGPSWMASQGCAAGGVEILTHCSGDYQMHIVAIEGTEKRAWRGDPKLIDPAGMPTRAEWNERLRVFCNAHDLEPSGEPGWYLCSMWG